MMKADSLTKESFDISRRTSNMLENTILLGLDYIVYNKNYQNK